MKIPLFWLAAAGAVIGLIAALSYLISIRQVRCWLQDHEMSSQSAPCIQLQALRGSRLLLRDFHHDPQIASFLYVAETKETFDIQRVEKSLSGEVRFFLSDRPPLYRVSQNGTAQLVTESGSLRENNDQVTVPTVLDQGGIYAQPETHRFLAELLLSLGEKKNQISQITLLSAERMELRIPGFPVILTELSQSPQQAGWRLAVILERLKPEEIDLSIRELDLRFDLPVLRTSQFQSSESAQAVIDSQE